MAYKGIIDLSIYVFEDFVIDAYTIPSPSQGDYFTPQGYVDSDYVLEALDLTSQFTVSAVGDLIDINVNITATFTVSCDAQDLDIASGSMSSAFTVSTDYIRDRSSTTSPISAFALSAEAIRIKASRASLSSQFTQTAQGGRITGITQSYVVTAAATQTAQANRISDSALSLIGFFTQIQLAGELIEARSLFDYTWDDFAESEFVDKTWDGWFGDQWDPFIILISASIITQANGGVLFLGQSTMEAVATQTADANVTYDTTQGITAQASVTTDYIRDRSSTTAVTCAASTSTNGNAVFGPTQQYIAQYSVSSDGNVVFDTTQEITAEASVSSNASVTFDLAYGQDLDAVASLDADGNAIYGSTDVEYFAFASEITIGRLITIPDPWNILTVPQELRTLVTPIETRIIPTEQETRVNNTTTENRTLEVEQETRAYRIFKPQFTNRSSIPKVRTDL